ncbi:hypothetical protein DY245_20580 [Streptomyces inhibens]|uniref:Uncharacterized protein n=1 Tax=Streptomyces inhibens TaxID=2293571 RepID=A0A371Q1G3_STRIH|nr:hypothetical protein DY245_20580 [Streptomyces inhibens]
MRPGRIRSVALTAEANEIEANEIEANDVEASGTTASGAGANDTEAGGAAVTVPRVPPTPPVCVMS